MEKKKFHWMLMAFLLMAAFSTSLQSCDDDDPDPELSVSSASLNFADNGGTQAFDIASNVSWSITASDSWIQLSKTSGKDNGSITVTVGANTQVNSDRMGTIIVTAEKGDLQRTITVSQTGPKANIVVSPTSASLLGEKGSSTTLSVTANGPWEMAGFPDWLHSTATSGNGNTTLTLTAQNENFSDEDRQANLTFTSNGVSTSVTVSQVGVLAKNLRVTTSNMTIMWDGFACDLKFTSEAKGYREAFFTESALRNMTDRDVYNKLMEGKEYSSLADFACLPSWVEPGTQLVYCIAAYGNENNSDGSHKYGPMTTERITTKQTTIYDDMYLTSSYNSSRWSVTAARAGNYGQRCDEYYYIAAEDDVAEELYVYSNILTYAFVAHVYFKPMIADNPNNGYLNGPQTLTFSRTGNKFFCTTWGIDRDTKQFSAELSDPIYRNLAGARQLERTHKSPAQWNQPFKRPTKAEIEKTRKAIKIYKVSK